VTDHTDPHFLEDPVSTAILVIAGAQLIEVFRRASAAFMPPAAADDLLRYLAEYVGRTAEMSPDLRTVTGSAGMTFAAWAAGRAASFR
jgi:hypothetical protein